jgi:UPF0755 protein
MKAAKILLLLVILVVSGTLWYQWGLGPADQGSPHREVIHIPSGTSVRAIGEILEEKGMVRSGFIFSLYVTRNDLDRSLLAGSFLLDSSQSVSEIVEILRDGEASESAVTIPEGFTVLDIDTLLADLGLSEPGEVVRCSRECDFSSFEFLPGVSFSDAQSSGVQLSQRGGLLEGYLFPDTYFVNASDFVPKFFLERLLSTFRRRILSPLETELLASERSLHDIVTMASLIEEETREDAERLIVSGILWKRFDAGRGLDVDAATRYILEKQKGPLTVNDLNDLSPYNTRKFRGLPPGPIANPGRKSIEAALRPEESAYWYYLHGTDGQIRYATTNEEHNINKWRYLR